MIKYRIIIGSDIKGDYTFIGATDTLTNAINLINKDWYTYCTNDRRCMTKYKYKYMVEDLEQNYNTTFNDIVAVKEYEATAPVLNCDSFAEIECDDDIIEYYL